MRRVFGVVVGLLVVAVALAGYAVPASAAIGDRVRSMTIAYDVSVDGVLHVTETIEYHFGSSGRHGIFRDLVIREPYADDRSKDQRYDVSNVQVSSPDAPAGFTTSTTRTNKARNQVLRIKIGSSDKTVNGRDATYRISYDVRGALRHFPDHSELYWDATGNRWEASLDHVVVTVTVPRGVTKVACNEGPPGSTASCDEKAVVGGKAVFTQETDVVDGEELTIVAGIKAGAVSNDTPIVVAPPGFLARYGVSRPAAIASVVLTLLAIAAGKLTVRRRDLRYDGLPPGTLPPAGLAARTVPDRLSEKAIPVAFAPPEISAAEGGLLIDGKVDTTEVAATLIDLAVRGAVRIEGENDVRTAVLVDAQLATEPHEKALLKGLFPKQQPGRRVWLGRPAVGDTRPQRAAERMGDALWKQAADRNWYARLPHRSTVVKSSGYGWVPLGCGVFLAALVGLVSLIVYVIKFDAPPWLGPAIVIAVPVLAVLNAIVDVILRRRAGRRSALGRAVTDQVVGFRQYLRTAEADQLRFEDGEDIFSKYLPWAIVLGLADRWQQVCKQLVDSGRLTAAPTWYAGSSSYYDSGWTAGSISSTVSSAFAAPPSPSTGGGSSSGFSSSSSSSSSSSGGGGGGGGGGSW